MSSTQQTEAAPSESAVSQTEEHNPLVMERLGLLSETNREFDVAFWQAQDAAARFAAAWEQIEFYHELKGLPKDELRLQRSIEVIQRRRS